MKIYQKLLCALLIAFAACLGTAHAAQQKDADNPAADEIVTDQVVDLSQVNPTGIKIFRLDGSKKTEAAINAWFSSIKEKQFVVSHEIAKDKDGSPLLIYHVADIIPKPSADKDSASER